MTDSTRSPFRIASPERVPMGGAPLRDDQPSGSPLERVERMVRSADIFVFLKGSPDRPQCGFSANTVAMLESVGARYSTFDVLSDEAIRSAAKQYAQWPTFPQVWVRGELIGGNDIVAELHESGELARIVEEAR